MAMLIAVELMAVAMAVAVIAMLAIAVRQRHATACRQYQYQSIYRESFHVWFSSFGVCTRTQVMALRLNRS
jgi:hypothetical protein